MAESRLRGLLRRLNQDRRLLLEYHQQLMDFVHLGWMQEVKPGGSSGVDNYLPHLPVIRPEKTSSKLRIVFDASAKGPGGLCLNDCVEVGDNLYPDMLALVLRFGWNAIAWIGDVTKAFLQLELQHEDRSACKVLWIKDVEQPLESDLVTLQWNRVTFGISCSPFLLAATIQKHLLKFESEFPVVTKKIRKDTFVDDWTGGAASVEEAYELIQQATTIFADAGMAIGKWETNNQQLKSLICPVSNDSSETSGALSGTLLGCSKMLGLRWDTAGDFYYFDPKPLFLRVEPFKDQVTKRGILQVSSKLFDPVGFIAPVIVKVKVLFQELWKVKGLGWDSIVPGSVRASWNSFIEDLQHLSLIKVPRYYFQPGQIVNQQLHVFGDACLTAYGAVAYMRITYADGLVVSRIIASKSRVAPVKGLTISRLELLAALTAARLGSYLQKALDIEAWPVHMWTDSRVAWYWITGRTERLLPWVRNRVVEICSLFPTSCWQHCPGVQNPADIVSRGSTALALATNSLWWNGPPWMVRETGEWPPKNEAEPSPEERSQIQQEVKRVLFAVERVTTSTPALNWDSFSSWSKLVRVVAWILRFLSHSRHGKPDPTATDAVEIINLSTNDVEIKPIDGAEMYLAEMSVLRAAQKEAYPEEFRMLAAGGDRVHNGSSLKDLRPVYDKKARLIRVTGRVGNSFDLLGTSPPILVPKTHQVAVLLIEKIHRQLNHVGYKTVHAELLRSYWVVGGRAKVKQVISSCFICKCRHSRPFSERTAPLPSDRVRESLPFEVSGVDYAGPLFVRGKGKFSVAKRKVWFIIFTCATTRAVYLDLVSDMTAETFLLALRRFFSFTNRAVRVMYSDNALTFHRTARYLKSVKMNRVVSRYLGEHQVVWKFNAAQAPWWGGFWERLVRSVKDLIIKTLGRSAVNRDQLMTLLKEIESTINNRPLSYVDVDELIPLTPALLISGFRHSPRPAIVSEDLFEESSECNLLRKEKTRLTLLLRWRKRWMSEYLHNLNNFKVRDRFGPKIKIGDMVLIQDENLKRALWRHGIIEKLHQGADGFCRSADIRTSTGTVSRPVQRLYPTELQYAAL